jgi:transporter family protein
MTIGSWQLWAVLSAVFAALTAIFAKIGVENINSDLATFIRTIVVLISFVFVLLATGQFVQPGSISGRTWTFLVLSGLGTVSVVLVALFGALFLGERPSPTGWLGIAMIGCGAILIASQG